MPRKYKRILGSRQYKDYSENLVEDVVKKIKAGEISQRKASLEYNIPRSTIQNKLKGSHTYNAGGQTILTKEEEESFVAVALKLSEYGFPIDSRDLCVIVKSYLDQKGVKIRKWKDNMPGYEWSKLFLRRHPVLTERFAANIKKSRASTTPQTINQYFDHLERELQGIPPSNIWNFDETNLSDDPGRKKVYTKRGCKYPERILNSSKVSISLMFCGNAEGDLLPPYVVYKSKHLYDQWTEGGPTGTRFNRTLSGWFDSNTFDDWFKSLLLPRLKLLQGPKAILGDNLSSHLSMEVVDLCQQNDIRFLCLPPNTTHITQPLDIAFFHPMKNCWRGILAKYKLRGSSTIAKSDFPRLLKTLVEGLSVSGPQNLRSGFRKAGIYPLERAEVLDRLPKNSTSDNSNSELLSESVLHFLEKQRYGEGSEENQQPKKKKKLDVVPGRSVQTKDLKPAATTNRTTAKESQKTKKPKKLSKEEVDETSSESDGEISIYSEFEVESTNEEIQEVTNTIKSDFKIDEFVIFLYEGDHFPGQIVETETEKIKISAMTSSGNKWKWPSPKDIIWYEPKDIKKKINAPLQYNSRGLFSVPEMELYQDTTYY